MGCSNKKNKNNKECCCLTSKFRADWRYCGEELECLGVERGDTLSVILEKINSVSCEGGSTYSFEENEECENGGFDIFKGEEKIFSQCYPCCGSNGCGGLYVSNQTLEYEHSPDYTTSKHIHSIEVEGGSGNYEYTLTTSLFEHLGNSGEYFINLEEDSGSVVIDYLHLTGDIIFTAMFTVTVKDIETGCIIQYPLYHVASFIR